MIKNVIEFNKYRHTTAVYVANGFVLAIHGERTQILQACVIVVFLHECVEFVCMPYKMCVQKRLLHRLSAVVSFFCEFDLMVISSMKNYLRN